MSAGEGGHIYKSAGVIIRDRKLLVERSKGKVIFIAPGGSIEAGETDKQALVRELMEEFGITVAEDDLEDFGEYEASAAGQEHKIVHMTAFMVRHYQGEPSPSSEVEEIAWVNSANEQNLPLGSIFEHSVIPELLQAGLID